ncbi:MAG: CBS domain-containing protein [Actinomycetota bacterium]|nr:CBS domain-containing protein [Actinomycetota bacterium]
MLLGPLAQPHVLTVDADATLASAAEEMWARRCGSAVVLGPDGKPGIITERDLLRAMAEGSDPGATPVSSYMTPNAVAVNASWEVVDAARRMIQGGFRHLIVTDDRGGVTGIVSIRDMGAALVEERQRVLAG